MEVFKVFATMNLVDAISKPLGIVRGNLKKTEASTESLSVRLGRLGSNLKKAALPAAAFLTGLTAATLAAANFESKLNDLGRLAGIESPAGLEGLGRTLQDISLQVPVTTEGLMELAEAGHRAGVAQGDLAGFAAQAAKTGAAFRMTSGEAGQTLAGWKTGLGLTTDQTFRLADAVNHLSRNFNASASSISQVLDAAGTVGQLAGLTERELAALAAAGVHASGNAGLTGKALNNMFTTLAGGAANMSKETVGALGSMGISAAKLSERMKTDARGGIMSVLEGLAALDDHKKIPALEAIFGGAGAKSIGPLLGNLDGLSRAFGMMGDAANYAGSVEAEFAGKSLEATTALQLMRNSIGVLILNVGQHFVPILNFAAQAVTFLIKGLIAFSRTEAGGFILKLAAGIASAVVAVTGLVMALALLKPVLLLISAAMAPIIGPILAIAGVVTLVALAWKTNFGGIADTLTNFFGKVKLVGKGVLAVFQSLSNGRGQLSAELAEKLEAAGLMGLVTTVSRIIYRVVEFFKGFGAGIKAALGPAFENLGAAFGRMGDALQPLFTLLGKVIGALGGAASSTGADKWATFGKVLGMIVSGPLWLLVTVFSLAVEVLAAVIGVVSKVLGWLKPFAPVLLGIGAAIGIVMLAVSTGLAPLLAIVAAVLAVGAVLYFLGKAIAWVFGKFMELVSWAWDAMSGVREAVSSAIDVISNFDLMAAGQALIETFISGIKAKAAALVETVSGVLGKVRAFIPFSDAKVGPLSNLTASGRAFPATLAQGITAGAPALYSATDKMLGNLNLAPPYYEMPGVRGTIGPPSPPNFEASRQLPRPSFNREEILAPAGSLSGKSGNGRSLTIHIGRVELPNVQDAQGFAAALEAIAAERV